MRKYFQRKSETGLNRLRDAIHMSRASEELDTLPERFAQVISRFEALNVDPNFRRDVYYVLNGACDVALSMVDQTFPVEQANNAISKQLSILARTIQYLQSRPSSAGFSILLPASHQLVGHFSTREEAEDQLQRYQALGMSKNCQVVPTKVLSLHAIQPTPLPTMPQVPESLARDFPDIPIGIVDRPLPSGIVPPANPDTTLNLSPEQDLSLKPTEGPPPSLGSADLLSRLDKLDEAAATLPKDSSK